ncbi:MAG: heavy metal translocating P-type ATPase, partial [Bellilinea sp.]
MIDRIRTSMRDPRTRAEIETIGSGVLIAAGLVARYVFQNVPVHNILMTIAAVIAGAGIAVRAWNSLRNRHISIEFLVTIATVGALAIGEVWEAAAVTFLFVFGAYLEARTLSKTRQVLGDLIDLAPVTALVLRNGAQVEVSPNEVQIGETVLLKPGARVPVDGEVLSGASAMDESSITGEPMPEEKAQGDRVFAGTVNLDGMLQIRATGVGSDTTLARIIARVEEAQEAKAPTQRFIERFSQWYTPAIIILSLGTYVITRDIELALTLLVIGCPGALVISTPVSIIAGIGSAARRGILIKGGEYLENAGKISAVALDKTGTLTYGKPRLTDILILQPALAGVGSDGNFLPGTTTHWDSDQSELLWWVGIAESGSEHPLARAIY